MRIQGETSRQEAPSKGAWRDRVGASGVERCEPADDLSGADDTFGFGREHRSGPVAEGDHLAAGDTVGHVRIVGPLGEGGMGSVYEGREAGTDRAVAVKLVKGAATSEARERFAREARLLSRLRHPAVAQLHAFGTRPGTGGRVPYLVMELVPEARSITRHVRETQLGLRDRVRLFRDACAGVAHAHAAGVVHRDLKPGNILVDAQGMPRVIDFGVARSLGGARPGEQGVDASFATTTGDLVGTLQYMSPEQLRGDSAAVDARSDVYALGLVLHELVADALPYDLRDASWIDAVRIVDGPAISAAAVARAARGACGRDDARSLAVIVATCLEKAPADRYASAADLVADLDRWLAGRGIVAKPPTVWESLRRVARRHPVATTTAACLGLLTIVALVTITSLSLAERRQRQEAEVARAAAERAWAEAERQTVAARRRLYFSTVLLAAEARDRGHAAEARRLVSAARDLVPPTGTAVPIELACLEASLDDSCGILAHVDAPTTAVAVHPDGRTAAVATSDGRVWLAPVGRTGKAAETVVATTVVDARHDGRVWRLAFSPDGQRLASAGADGRVFVRDIDGGRVPVDLAPHDGPVYGLAFSPDGMWLATAGRDGRVRIWDGATGASRLTVVGHRGSVYAVAFSPDGATVASGGADRVVRLWDAETGELCGERTGHEARIFDVAFCPDGSELGTASEDGSVRRWRTTGHDDELSRLRHPLRVNALAYIDTHRVATAAGDDVLRVWDLRDGSVERLRGHVGPLWSVAGQRGDHDVDDGGSDRGRTTPPARLVTAADDGTLRFWQLDGPRAGVLPAGDRVLATAYAPDGCLLAAALANGEVLLRPSVDTEPMRRLGGGVGRVNGIAFSADGALLAGACDDGAVVIWSLTDGVVHATHRPHTRRVYSVAFSADGRRLLTASEDGTARLWDVATGDALAAPLRHGRRVFRAAFAPDGAVVATACEDRTVRLWDVATGVEKRRLSGHEGPVNWLEFSRDGTRLATASSDRSVRLWRLADGACEAVLSGPSRQVWKAAFSPDGGRVAAVSADGSTSIWDAVTGQAALTLRAAVQAGVEVATAGEATTPPSRRRGHTDQVWGLAFSPDGRRLATGSWDGTVRLWGVGAADGDGTGDPANRLPTADSWNGFRGSTGDGHADAALPLEWSETRHVRWKTPLPGKAWASPVEADGRIWLANATEDGRRLSAVCVAADTGAILHDVTLFEPADPAFCHPYNSHASPTPVIVGDRVFVSFGSAGTACLDAAAGTVLWKRDDLACDHHRGPGSSPIADDGLLFMNFDGVDVQYVVALDQATGQTVWRTDRTTDYGTDNGDFKKAYCTPTIVEHDGRRELVSPGAVATIAYDPRTGVELWKVAHGGYNAAARPLHAGGLVVIVTQGGDRIVAVRPGGSGDVTQTHVAWKFGKATPTRPAPCVVGEHLYMVSDTGIFTCLELASGRVVWQGRREGRHSAALLESQGRLYACDEDGTTVIVAASPDGFRILAENRLDAGCMASPAVVGEDLLIRTKTHLYRIGD